MSNHDESTNYLAYPTLMPLPVQQDTEAEQLQRLLAEKKKYLAELECIEAEIQRLEERQRQRAVAERKARQKKQNILGDVGDHESKISLDGATSKMLIREICFLNTLAGAPQGAADLSEAQDGGVLCWTEGTVQYIAGEGGVVGGHSCADLFAGYQNVTAVRFDGNFNTSRVTDMNSMFSGCNSLTTLNLTGFNISLVTDMCGMFGGCKTLTALNLSSLDTSNVKNMCMMFAGCSSLKTLDLSSWDTSHATDMFRMFWNCKTLTTLNLSGWDTSHVTDMRSMFRGCQSLSRINPRWLDTSHADTTDMYKGTRC